MSTSVFLTYIAAVWLLSWTPGPMMSLIIANVTTYGMTGGLWTLAGNVSGLAVIVAAAAVGMTSLMTFMSEWFDIVRWIGALYLLWLGASRLYQLSKGGQVLAAREAKGRDWFFQAFMVSVSNPKVLLFLGAFLPQFVDRAGNVPLQLAILAVTFVVVIGLGDCSYTVALAKVRGLVAERWLRTLDGIAAGLLVAGGLVLAMARRP